MLIAYVDVISDFLRCLPPPFHLPYEPQLITIIISITHHTQIKSSLGPRHIFAATPEGGAPQGGKNQVKYGHRRRLLGR